MVGEPLCHVQEELGIKVIPKDPLPLCLPEILHDDLPGGRRLFFNMGLQSCIAVIIEITQEFRTDTMNRLCLHLQHLFYFFPWTEIGIEDISEFSKAFVYLDVVNGPCQAQFIGKMPVKRHLAYPCFAAYFFDADPPETMLPEQAMRSFHNGTLLLVDDTVVHNVD